jgi:hypothetical protein
MTTTQTQFRRDTAANIALATPTAGEPFYDTTNKRLGVGDGATAGGKPHASANDVQLQKFVFPTVGGTANAITLTNVPPVGALTSGLKQVFIATSTNTTSVTAAVDGLTAKTIKKMAFGALANLVAGDIVSGGVYEIIYDGTQFQAKALAENPYKFYLAFSDISGTAASAAGTHNVALGDSAVAASGTRATAIGKSYASGDDSVAIGIGDNTSTYGAQSGSSVAIGHLNKADAAGSSDAVVGGEGNTVSSSGGINTITGGSTNSITGTVSSATIVGGGGNEIDQGASSVVIGGTSCTNSASYSAIIASLVSTISNAATESVIVGGSVHTVTEIGCVVLGGARAKADRYGQHVQANGFLAANGDSQVSSMVASGQTTDATQTEIFLDAVAASKRMTIASNTSWRFRVEILAHRTGTNESASYEVKGLIRNQGGTTALKGSITKTVEYEDDATWDVDVQADNTHDALVIKVTGAAAKTINWVARVTTVETTG